VAHQVVEQRNLLLREVFGPAGKQIGNLPQHRRSSSHRTALQCAFQLIEHGLEERHCCSSTTIPIGTSVCWRWQS
jgi:hypothetical protein